MGALASTVRLFWSVDDALVALGDDSHDDQADEMLIAALLSPADWSRERAQSYFESDYRGENPQVADALQLSLAGDEAAMEEFLLETSRRKPKNGRAIATSRFGSRWAAKRWRTATPSKLFEHSTRHSLLSRLKRQTQSPTHTCCPSTERLDQYDRLAESREVVIDSGLGLDPSHEDRWRSIVFATPIGDLREALNT